MAKVDLTSEHDVDDVLGEISINDAVDGYGIVDLLNEIGMNEPLNISRQGICWMKLAKMKRWNILGL